MQTYYQTQDLEKMERRHRAKLINSLSGFKSVCLVGTKNKAGKSNLAVFNSVFHLGANPALMGMIVRPDSVERHTYENICDTEVYTLNHINSELFVRAHQTSARYAREESEFEKCGIDEEYLNNFTAPYVRESNIKIGLVLREKKPLEINGTTLLIGEVKHIYINGLIINTDGFIDIEAGGSITCSGLDSYHKTERLARISYAKPNKWPGRIDDKSRN